MTPQIKLIHRSQIRKSMPRIGQSTPQIGQSLSDYRQHTDYGVFCLHCYAVYCTTLLMKPGCLLTGCCGLWLAASVGLAQSVPAKSPPFIVSVKHLTLEQGLPNRTVLALGQDAQGFVWIGTLGNAYRFDGRQFAPLPTVATTPQQQVYNPGFNEIRTDRRGNLWLAGTIVDNQREQYFIQRGQTRPHALDSAFGGSTRFGTDFICEFATATTNTFQYFRTRSGTIWRYSPEGKLRPIFRHSGLVDVRQAVMHETDRHTLLVSLRPSPVATSRFVLELDSTGHICQRYTLPPRLDLSPVWQDTDGSLYLFHAFDWAGGANGTLADRKTALYRLSPGGALTALSLGVSDTPSLVNSQLRYDARHGLFWLAGRHRLLAWHPTQGVVFDLSASSLLMATVQLCDQVFVDRTGVVWVGTANGVVLLTLEPNRFQRYLHLPETELATNRVSTRGMLQVGNRLLVNAEHTCWVDLQTGRSQPAFNSLQAGQRFCAVIQTPDRTIWTFGNGGVRVKDNALLGQLADDQPLNDYVSIWPAHQTKLWLGQQHGLSVFDTRQNQAYPFTRYNQFPELRQNLVAGFFPDKESAGVWLAASSGLYRLDTLRGIQARYSVRDTGKHHLPFDYITFMHPDPDSAGVYWLATHGGGLIRWNHTTGRYTHFTTKQGLSDNTIYAIYEDKYHRLWLPSNYGLMAFHRRTHQVQVFHTNDGIADEEFNLISHYRAPDGRLFLGGLNGITAFYPDQIQPEKPVLIPLQLTQYQKLATETGRMVDHLTEYRQQPQIRLTASDRLFRVSFGLLDYRYLDQARLWYRIRGWQENWVLQEGLDLSINGLPTGDYTLEVRAQTSNGVWASPVFRVPIGVDPPVYLRWWFLGLCVLLFSGGLMALWRWRNRQLTRETVRLEAEVARRTAQIERDKAIIAADKATIEQQAADLRASATLKSRFFANVSHEFRTPLTLILGPVQYLKKQTADPTGQALLGVIERNTQHQLTLVNNLFDLTRLDVQPLQLTEQPADLAQLVQQTVANFRPQAQHLNINLVVEGADTPCQMPFDSPKVETLLRNLIDNALRYTPWGGTITLRLEQADDQVRLSVSDTGRGIHPDDLPHIFDRYFQSAQAEQSGRGSLGLGLALCQEYCTLWGGTIGVQSTVGQGTCFTVSYPIRSTPELPDGEMPTARTAPVVPAPLTPLGVVSEEPLPVAASNTRILLVEDNSDMVLYIQTLLAPHYAVQLAHNGREALDLLNALPPEALPNLIISDIMMPEVDGLAFVHQLRTQRQWRHLPVIFLTARIDLETRLQALKLGIADYLTKPFEAAELLARMQNLLQRAKTQLSWQAVGEEASFTPTQQAEWLQWLQWLQEIIRANLTNPLLSVKWLAEQGHLSERQLHRHTKAFTGLSPQQFIQEVRLQLAQELLLTQPHRQIKAIAAQVGYQKVSYFSQLYRERFGIMPSERSSVVTDDEVSLSQG